MPRLRSSSQCVYFAGLSCFDCHFLFLCFICSVQTSTMSPSRKNFSITRIGFTLSNGISISVKYRATPVHTVFPSGDHMYMSGEPTTVFMGFQLEYCFLPVYTVSYALSSYNASSRRAYHDIRRTESLLCMYCSNAYALPLCHSKLKGSFSK